jgi:peptidoglycan hydrolase CwlO-like protein
MSDASKSAGNNDEHIWVSENDPGKLENQLSILGLKFADKRKEPSRYPVWAVILASGVVFVSLFSATYMAPTDSISGLPQETINQRIQNALIFGLTGGIIPSISYGVLRNRELQHRNDELAALSVEKRELRSKITTIRQQLTFETLGKQNTEEGRIENEEGRIENEIGQLRELVEKSLKKSNEALRELREVRDRPDVSRKVLSDIERTIKEILAKQQSAESRIENEIGQLRELVEKSVSSTDEASHKIQEIQEKVDTLTREVNEIKRNRGSMAVGHG